MNGKRHSISRLLTADTAQIHGPLSAKAGMCGGGEKAGREEDRTDSRDSEERKKIIIKEQE